MSKRKLACIILAAGKGKRMKSALPKVMHPLAGRPMLHWLLESVKALGPEKIIVVSAPDGEAVRAAAPECDHAVQEVPRGTGDAVRAALPALAGFDGDVLILLGDMPLLSTQTLRALIEKRYHDGQTVMAVLGAEYDPVPAYGRLVLGTDGALARIVEDKDCSADERSIKLCNTGAFCVDGTQLPMLVRALDNDNAQGEYYITDIVALAAQHDMNAHVHITRKPEEVRGVNDRADLAALEKIVQHNLRQKALAGGASLSDPDSVYMSWDTQIGSDVIIEPGVFCGPGVVIEEGAHIKAYSYLEGATVKSGAAIGPFARLRPGAVIGADSRIGNFVEIKNAQLGRGVKAGHLAYIGDAVLGDDVNFSCGAITVNYDGANKHKTVIGSGVMVGSNVNLVAPVEIGDGAYIAAGSTITKAVPGDALAVAREKPVIIDGWAAKKRSKKQAG